MAADLAPVRRGEIDAERLALEHERLELDRARAEGVKEKEFWKWIKRPAIRKKHWPRRKWGLRSRTLGNIERELKLM